MFAIIESGGRQIRVGKGDTVSVDLMDAQPGDKITIDKVLFVENGDGDFVAGAPFVANAQILAEVAGEERGPKIRIFVKKRRKGYRRTKGFRSTLTKLRITDIKF
ncbi:MAG: 50S ribosomal protein L21 [Acidobacteriota bacterium]|nr:50S ribosomal protein L21 [Acidobacteriota bacterium]